MEAAHVEHAEVAVRTDFDAGQLRDQLDGDILLPVVLVATAAQRPDGDTGLQALRSHWPHLPALTVDAGQPESLAPLRTLLLDALGRMPVRLLERAADDAAATTVLVPLASDVAAKAGSQGRVKGARIWGASVGRVGLTVSLRHIVDAGDGVLLA